MSRLIKPRLWNVRPALVAPKWRFFWKDLIFAVPFLEGTGLPKELNTGGLGTRTALATWGSSAVGPGMVLVASGNQNVEFPDNKIYDHLGSITCFVYAVVVDIIEPMAFFHRGDDTAGDDTPFLFKMSSNPSDGSLLLNRANTTFRAWRADDLQVTTNVPFVASVSAPLPIETAAQFYLTEQNGAFRKGATTSNGGSATGSPTPPISDLNLKVGNRQDGADDFAGQLFLVGACRGVWTDEQHRLFHSDPFGPFTYDDSLDARVVYAKAGGAVAEYYKMHRVAS